MNTFPDSSASPLALPGPTVVELSNLTQFMILIVIVFLIFQGAQITSTIKSKIKRVKVAKHSLNSMAVLPGPQSPVLAENVASGELGA